ncbi:MAG TPA: hypothetical protein VGL48_12745 [Acidimicrobiales bacterium]|jgi:hypothetical protein
MKMGRGTGSARPRVVVKAKHQVRRSLNRVDNESVRRARSLLHALHHHPPDVLYLGDSAVSFVGAQDADRRRLSTMVADALGSGTAVHVVDGPSFNADIYDAYLGLLKGMPLPSVIVVPLCVRVRFSPWIEHPVHGHKRAIQKIREFDPSRPSWHVHGAFRTPHKPDFDAFHRVPYPNLLGQKTVGDFVSQISAYQRSGDNLARERLLYAYHHGGLLTAGSAAMEAVTVMGQTLRELGCTTVVYQTPVPVQKGIEHYGTEFRSRTEQNFAVLNEAYRLGAGADAAVIESGGCFSTDEFIDPRDATEHLNEAGRRRLAGYIVNEINAAGNGLTRQPERLHADS